jgi:hypothetical protein
VSLSHLIAIGREENTALFSQLLTLSFVASFSSSQSASMLLASPILSQMQTNLSKSTVSNAFWSIFLTYQKKKKKMHSGLYYAYERHKVFGELMH